MTVALPAASIADLGTRVHYERLDQTPTSTQAPSYVVNPLAGYEDKYRGRLTDHEDNMRRYQAALSQRESFLGALTSMAS